MLTEHNVPDAEINKMTHENAMRWYHFDPFTHIPKDQATVGALRKAAEGHDVSIHALSARKGRRRQLRRLRGERQGADRRYRTESRWMQAAYEVFAPARDLNQKRRIAVPGGGMSFELTDDQELIRKSVAELASKFDDHYWMEKDQAHEFPVRVLPGHRRRAVGSG